MNWSNKVRHITARKSTELENWSALNPLLNAAHIGHHFSRTKWSVAQAYIVIGYVEKCVELIASGIESLPYAIKRFERGATATNERWTGVEIARSDDPIPLHPLFQLFHSYEDNQHISFIFRVAASLTLYDELFIELVRKNEDYEVSQYNPLLGVEWLNPLAMSINASRGRITDYFYSPVDTAKATTYNPFEILYKHGYNPQDDLRGYPDVLAVLESLEIDFSIQTAVVSHFRNGIQGMGMASPKEGFSNLQHSREGMDEVRRRSRGAENVGGIIYWPRGVDFTALPYPDYAALTTYSQETGDRILNQFGVSRAILGNSDIAGYKQGDEVTYRFYVGNIIPRADAIVKFINRRLVPLLPPQYHLDRMVIDRSEFDRVSENDEREAGIAGQNLKNTIITINEARARQGLNEWPPERGNLLIVPSGVTFLSPDKLESGYSVGVPPDQTGSVPEDKPPMPPGGAPQQPTPEGDVPGGEPKQTSFETEPVATKYNHVATVKSVTARSQASFSEWDWSVENAQKELDAWYTFVKRRKQDGLARLEDFEPYYTRGDIADTLIASLQGYDKSESGITVKAVFELVKEWVAVKAVQATRIEFEDDFEDTLQALIDDQISNSKASAAIRSRIRLACNKAFRDGLEDGGAVGEEPTDAEQVEINQHVQEQSQYVTALLGSVKSEKWDKSVGRGSVWWNKSIMPMYQAGVASAGGNMMSEWVMGDTEHCKSCLAYNGQRHRYKHWLKIGAMPQSDTLACHGDNCKCKLVPVKASARGTLELVTKSIQELMKAGKWEESKHPRAVDGKFGAGGGDSAGGGDKPKEEKKPDKPAKEEPAKPDKLPEEKKPDKPAKEEPAKPDKLPEEKKPDKLPEEKPEDKPKEGKPEDKPKEGKKPEGKAVEDIKKQSETSKKTHEDNKAKIQSDYESGIITEAEKHSQIRKSNNEAVSDIGDSTDKAILENKKLLGSGEITKDEWKANDLVIRKEADKAKWPLTKERITNDIAADQSKFYNEKLTIQAKDLPQFDKNKQIADAADAAAKKSVINKKLDTLDIWDDHKSGVIDKGELIHRVVSTEMEYDAHTTKMVAESTAANVAKVNIPATTPIKPDTLPEQRFRDTGKVSEDGLTRTLNDTTYKELRGSAGKTDFEKQGADYIKDLPDTEKDSIRSYTGSGYKEISKVLRKGEPPSIETERSIANLDSAIAKSPPLQEPLRLYRGDGGKALPSKGILSDTEFLDLGDTSFEYTDDGYMSTSIDPKEAFIDNYRYEILAPAGTKGIYVGSGSAHEVEREYLLARNGRYRVISTEIRGKNRHILLQIMGGV